ncbi:MAG TPA: chemotaxis protein CheA [Blastocatellia bacterium]|nr:chemotaxis protein CheA [Blastocatellia bacterium]
MLERNILSIADSKAQSDFFEEFLDDYFAESEEHLTVLRRGLLALESFVNQPHVNRPLLDELFRSFHSLKGISGMVGVREAEHLAHEMESYLRALRQGDVMLSGRGLEALIAGTKVLEQVISARREMKSPPDIAPVISRLQSILPARNPVIKPAESPAPSGGQAKTAGDNQVVDRGESATKLWRFEFAPTPALAALGVSVTTVRARLGEIGELKTSAPRVLPGGGIAFEFVVATRQDESSFAALGQDGLTYELIQEPDSTPAPAVKADSSEAGDETAAPVITPSSIVRVSLSRLDELMRMVGELVISRARLEDNLKSAEPDMPATRWRPLQETNSVIERQLRDLREAVMRVRMVPVGEIFERMRFVVRDLAREYQKKVRLELSGQETEIDKLLIERMMDPLLHLVRNAVSHGLESASERAGAGKPAEGVIMLRAFTAAETVVIEVEDDGRGIDRERVVERAQQAHLIADGTKIDDQVLLDLICSPGFSTRDEADRASGRGVGMAIVQTTVLGLGGAFQLYSEAGRGTKFTIQLPVTLAVADALIVTAGGQRFAVPQSAVREVIEVEPRSVKSFESNEVIHYRGGVLPLIRLARLFGLEENYDRAFHAFVVGQGSNAAGVAVTRILGQREIVVRAINDPLIQVNGISGATELGDGRVVLILDAAALVKRQTNGRGVN